MEPHQTSWPKSSWRRKTVKPAVFDLFYSKHEDPWRYRSSWYEHRKYNLTIAALPRQRYANAFEPACSIGVLTRLLARRCGHVVAVDCSERAVATARTNLSDLKNVEILQAVLPEEMPDVEFDLVVLSEFFYYLSWADLEEVVQRTVRRARPEADFVAVHRVVQEGFLDLHSALERCRRLTHLISYREKDFILDVFRRT